jgi:pyridoxal/pyridoxine/pyridoxamine kinase
MTCYKFYLCVYQPQFSNHTGYPVLKGHVFDGQHLLELLAGLKANDLLCHTHLLSGDVNDTVGIHICNLLHMSHSILQHNIM